MGLIGRQQPGQHEQQVRGALPPRGIAAPDLGPCTTGTRLPSARLGWWQNNHGGGALTQRSGGASLFNEHQGHARLACHRGPIHEAECQGITSTATVK